MKFLSLCALFILIGSLSGAVVDRAGNTYREIVVSATAPDSVQLAAREFQKFMADICGAELKIVQKSELGPVIYIGESEGLKEKGITAEGIPSEGYIIKTVGSDLVIIGSDYAGKPLLGIRNPWRGMEAYNPQLKLCAFGDAGTLTGVYEFLRQVCGVRFYMPGDLGTVLPKTDKLVIPELNISGKPQVEYRYPWFSMFELSPESALWARRVGFGGRAPVMIIHSYDFFLKYRETNPEYFALVNGKRAFGNECVADGKGHLCLTNPAVIQRWTDDIISYFEANPQMDIYPLGPNDGLTRICECPNCSAELRPDEPETGRFSYHIWNFTAKVAALVAKRFPDKYVGNIAYEKYRKPPVEIEKMPNVAVMFCNARSALANPEQAAAIHSEIEAWSEKVDRVYLWSWYLDHWLPWTGLPVVYTDTIERELKYLFKNPKYHGEFIEAEGQNGSHNQLATPGLEHLNLYVTARIYWEPESKAADIVDEYCKLFYGPAEAEMKSFWNKAQETREQAFIKNSKVTPDIVFTPNVLSELGELLKKGIAKTEEGTPYRKRVQLIQKEFNTGAQRLTRLSDAGERKLNLTQLQNIGDLDKIKPVIFSGKNGEAYAPATWMYAGYDRHNLYFRFLCFEPEMDTLKVKITAPDDGRIWEDDSIELFICSDETKREKCFHLIANANGVLFDGTKVTAAHTDATWNSNATVKAVKQKKRWMVDIAIPFSSIGIIDPFFTGNLAANFYRNRAAGGELSGSSWAPTGVYYHFIPEKFGIIELKK